jgi:2,3-bisphosphoglycerate-independent phosphoglycerate mutase
MSAKAPRPVVLCILDGWGWRDDPRDNALAAASIPVWTALRAAGPSAFLATSGPAVGLPEGQMGNSEVGHMNIGGGRVLVQDLDRASSAIADGSLARNPVLAGLIGAAKTAGGALHVMGLLSPGGVHSHQEHIAALALTGAASGLDVWIHAFYDGRDMPPESAAQCLKEFRALIGEGTRVRFATGGGRFYAMDRDKRWERVAPAYEAMVAAAGPRFDTPEAQIEAARAAGETDEFVTPGVFGAYPGMRDGDAVLMANFRADRARQIMEALLWPAFEGFERSRRVRFSAAAGLTEYSKAIAQMMPSLFPPQNVPDSLGEAVAKAKRTQLRISETEKYAHVTFFFNGGRETQFPGEERILVPSPKVRTYDLAPEMAAGEVTDRLVAAIGSAKFDLIVVNYANPDQVGHTGDLAAAVKAVEFVDHCLGRVAAAVTDAGGLLLVTADHGNVEMMRDPVTGAPHTAHTTFDVPLILTNTGVLPEPVRLADGKLADLAPTILTLMGLPVPAAMTGRSLLRPASGSLRGAA